MPRQPSPIVALLGVIVIVLFVAFIARYVKLPRLETLTLTGLLTLGFFESAFFVLSLHRIFDRPLYFLAASILILVTAIMSRDVFKLSGSGASTFLYGIAGGVFPSVWILTKGRRSRY